MKKDAEREQLLNMLQKEKKYGGYFHGQAPSQLLSS